MQFLPTINTAVYSEDESLDPIDSLAYSTVRIAEYVKEWKPHVMVGCDRGGRIPALATTRMFKERYGEQLPTANHGLEFARLSKRMPDEDFTNALHDALYRSLDDREIDLQESIRILFIDDHAIAGETQRQVGRALSRLEECEFEVTFAVSNGVGADLTGSEGRFAEVWENDPRLIGVDYDEDNRPFVPVEVDAADRPWLGLRAEVYNTVSELAGVAKEYDRKGRAAKTR